VIFNLLEDVAFSDLLDFAVGFLPDVHWTPSILMSSFFFVEGPTFGQRPFFTYLQFRQAVDLVAIQHRMWSRWQLLHCIELSVGTFLPRLMFFVCALYDNLSWASDRLFVVVFKSSTKSGYLL
jgi:hypothetical protein